MSAKWFLKISLIQRKTYLPREKQGERKRERERERDAGLEDTTVNNLKQSQGFTDCPHDSDMNAYT